MTNEQSTQDQIAHSLALIHNKLDIRSGGLTEALPRARRRLPKRVYKVAQILAKAEPLLAHPKLRLTLDHAALKQAATDLQTYLESIDTADRRKGWWLSMLGGLSFNLLALCVILIVVLVWRGYL